MRSGWTLGEPEAYRDCAAESLPRSNLVCGAVLLFPQFPFSGSLRLASVSVPGLWGNGKVTGMLVAVAGASWPAIIVPRAEHNGGFCVRAQAGGGEGARVLAEARTREPRLDL